MGEQPVADRRELVASMIRLAFKKAAASPVQARNARSAVQAVTATFALAAAIHTAPRTSASGTCETDVCNSPNICTQSHTCTIVNGCAQQNQCLNGNTCAINACEGSSNECTLQNTENCTPLSNQCAVSNTCGTNLCTNNTCKMVDTCEDNTCALNTCGTNTCNNDDDCLGNTCWQSDTDCGLFDISCLKLNTCKED